MLKILVLEDIVIEPAFGHTLYVVVAEIVDNGHIDRVQVGLVHLVEVVLVVSLLNLMVCVDGDLEKRLDMAVGPFGDRMDKGMAKAWIVFQVEDYRSDGGMLVQGEHLLEDIHMVPVQDDRKC